jgi:hypothetical protein
MLKFFFLTHLFDLIPVEIPAFSNVAVLDTEIELSEISELAIVIVAVVVAIFIYLFIC